jgi:acyl-CoA thioesterase FadM
MREGDDGDVLATAEHMLLSVNTAESRACPLVAPVTERLAAVAEGHGTLEAPDFAGRAIRAV